MLDKQRNLLIGKADNQFVYILPAMLNRHGLITGATGTGKTVTLQTLAESMSALGVPVFMADVKGDLTGLARPAGNMAAERVRDLGLEEEGYQARDFPVCLWDVYGEKGHPIRATISETGPILLARLLNLTEVQTGVLQIIFKVADDNGLLLLDLKDLRSMANFVSENRDTVLERYGQVAPASIGAIQRALLRLEEEGGDLFFGEPALNVEDLMRTRDGAGIINILDATRLINSPGLYSCVLMWLLSELYERLPEAGDLEKPRLVFFFDEAHLLFDGVSPVLLKKIEQVARLIRSKGVGVFFVSQNPSDIPDSVLGQLGNRVQHALRGFTPKDQKAIRAAATAFRPNPRFDTQDVIGSLGVGEALVSFLNEKGAPAMVERVLIAPPQSQIGPISDLDRNYLRQTSPLAGVYDTPVDRESAYEILTARAEMLQQDKEAQAHARAMEKAEKARVAEEERARKAAARQARQQPGGLDGILGSVLRQTTRSVTNTVGRELGKTILRGVLGGLLGRK